MIDFSNLSPEQLTGLSITLPLAHLFEIVEHTAERVVDKFKEEILPAHKPVDQDPLIPRLEVMRILGVCSNTLRNWRRSKLPLPHQRKSRLTPGEIQAIKDMRASPNIPEDAKPELPEGYE